MDGNGGPMFAATEITKAAKCLKNNPNFKSVHINPEIQSMIIQWNKRTIITSINDNTIIIDWISEADDTDEVVSFWLLDCIGSVWFVVRIEAWCDWSCCW